MHGDKWTDAEAALFDQLYAQGMDPADMAAHFPARSPKAVRCRWERAMRRQGRPMKREASKAEAEQDRAFESQGDRATVTVSGLREEVKDLDDLVRVCRIDREAWDVEAYRQKAYQGFHKTGPKGSEKAVKVQLYSVSASLKARKVQNALKAEIQALLEQARAEIGSLPVQLALREGGPSGGYMASVNLTDLHVGKYAWAKECGANYDVEIAERLLFEAIEDLIAKLAPYKIGLFVVTVGSDLLNSDNSENTTTGGTPQTTDGRHQRTFRRTWQMMRRAILRLWQIAPVHVVCIPGNHDRDQSFAIGEVLSVAFENYDGISVDNSPASRKYVRWGKCLVGYTHGDRIKTKDIPAVMAEECAADWGATLWRCMETGHLHQQLVTEYPGVLVRVNPALCGPEDWHHGMGYVGKIRALHCQLWHEEAGNLASISSDPIQPIRAQVVRLAA